jgi:hypothetical protein
VRDIILGFVKGKETTSAIVSFPFAKAKIDSTEKIHSANLYENFTYSSMNVY